MKSASYNPKDDILRILWSNNEIKKSEEVEPGVSINFLYDHDYNIIGIEVLNASEKIKLLN